MKDAASVVDFNMKTALSSNSAADKFPSLVAHQISPITGEPCCSRAIKLMKPKGEMQEYISQFKTPRKSTALIRTGCIACLRDGVKCDGTNPHCRRTSATTQWRMNNDMAWRWQGTWRERKGFHAFINFALAPERTGLFESIFWHKTVMQACFSNDAVFHVASAIGSLQQHVFQQSFNKAINDSGGLAFALRQCNRAITLLVASANNPKQPEDDPGIPLIACVLFAIFEALHGDTEQTINHSRQGRKLLQNCEMLSAAGKGSRLLDPMTVRPVIGGLEIQAKALQGKKMEIPSASEEIPNLAVQIPMPDVERIHSLEHANWSLHYVYISLLVFCQGVSLAASPAEIESKWQEKIFFFSHWLRKWEKAFAEYLFREAESFSLRDMQKAKVLKANHLNATMLATIDQGGNRDVWTNYDQDCKAIIDLSAFVLNTYSLNPHATLSTFQFPFLTFGLWVAEPLFVVMSRCHNPELQRQAAGLLTGQPRATHAQQILTRKPLGVDSDLPLAQKDTDEWEIEQWIEFAKKTRLDAAMATYFARLPSEYIDKPVYFPSSA